ncbi:MAG: phage tail protein [Mesorhizobium sp.]
MPIFTAIAGIFAGISSFIGGLGAIGTFVLKTVAGIGLNLIAKAIAGKPEGPKFEIKGKIQGGGDVPRSFAVGWAATAGSLVYQNEWGKSGKTPNAYSTRVIALFDLPVGELVQVMINGDYATLGNTPDAEMGYPVLEYRKDGKDYQWVKFYDGTQTVADPFLVGKVSSTDRPYESTRVGTGVAYAICTSLLNQELYTGFPEYKFSVNGTKWYDPSKDSTAGGAGTHRWNNPATWGGDGDHFPAVQIFNLLRGVSFGGKWFYGLQNTAAPCVPAANFIAQIAKCRAAIKGPGGDQPTYRTGGEIPVNSTVADTITALLTGCQGRLAEFGGTYDLHVGAPDEPAFAITDDDIISTEEQSFTPFFGLSDTINGIAAKCPDPAQLWNVKVLPPLYNADYEAEDGNRRLLADVSLDLVPYVAQGQMLQKSALAEARRARRHTYVLPPKFWAKAVPNTTFTWTSARNGYATKRFRIDGAADKANLDNLVDITEIDPSDFSWDFDSDFHPVPDGPVGPIRPPAQLMTGWQVFPAALTDANGNNRRPSIGVRYDGDLDDVQFVRVKVRLDAGDVLQFDGTLPYGDPATNDNPASVILNGTFLPNTNYEVQGDLVPYSGRATTPSAWLPVKTDDIRLGDNDVYLPGMVKEINDRTDLVLTPLNVNLRDQIENARQIALAAMNQDAGQYLDRQQSLTQVKSVFDTVTADYQLLVTAATGPGSAIVQRLETLEVNLGDVATVSALNSIGLVTTDVNGVISGVGTAITGIMAQVANSLAQGQFRTYVEATEAGALATVGISAAASSGGPTSLAAILVSALANGKSMIGLVADLVYMTDGAGNKVYPFVFSGGVARLQNIVVGTLKFDQLSSNNSKLVLRGAGSLADISVFV